MAEKNPQDDSLSKTQTKTSPDTFVPVKNIDLWVFGENPNKGLIARLENDSKNLWILVYHKMYNKQLAHVAMTRAGNNKAPAAVCKIHDTTQRMDITFTWPNGKSLTVYQGQQGIVNKKYKVQLPNAPAATSDPKRICYWKNTDAHGCKDGIKLVNQAEDVLYAAMIPVADPRMPFRLIIYEKDLPDFFVEQILFSGAVLMEKKHLFGNKIERRMAGGAFGIIGSAVVGAVQKSGDRHGHW